MGQMCKNENDIYGSIIYENKNINWPKCPSIGNWLGIPRH